MKKVLLGVVIGLIVIGVVLFVCLKPEKESEMGGENSTENNQEPVKKFEDLTKTERIGSFDDVWVDVPSWRVGGSETSLVLENMNYFIVAAISKEEYSFDEIYENEMKSTLKHSVNRGDYTDFVPESEEVILNNGIKATKFEGTLSMDSYGTLYEYPAYGYYFKFNDYPVMIMSVETDIAGKDKNSEEQRQTTNRYVDEIIQTIRSAE